MRSSWTVADRLAALAAALVLAYAGLTAAPATWWFDPGVPIVADSTTEAAPEIGFTRTIRRDTLMSYQVVIRRADGLATVCDPSAGPFTYRRAAKLPAHVDLVWWTGGDSRCWPRQPGTYVMETCWTVEKPFAGLLPPKTVCRASPPFRIGAGR